jgi:hypothetical protein
MDMPITNLDFQLTLNGTYGGTETWSAVFFYRTTNGSSPTAAMLAQAFDGGVIASLAAWQTTATLYSRIDVINLGNPGDFFSLDPVQAGGTFVPAEGEFSKFWDAMGFRYNRSTRLSRNGSKRFPGYDESAVDAAGTVVNAPYLALLNACAAALAENRTNSGHTFRPMIPRRILVPNPGNEPPEHYILNELYPISSVTVTGATSQNSRKP